MHATHQKNVWRANLVHACLHQAIAGTESAVIEMEHNFEDSSETLIISAIAGLSPRVALQQGAALLELHGLALRRAQVHDCIRSWRSSDIEISMRC